MDTLPMLLSYLAAGAVIGVALLPFKVARTDRPVMHVLAFACFWPYLLVHLAWFCLLAYRSAWHRYIDQRDAESYMRKQRTQSEDLLFVHDTSGKAIEDTHFKNRGKP